MKKEELKGYIFEMLVLNLVLKSGYHLFPQIERDRMSRLGPHKLEYKGRGSKHQIDVPVDLDYTPDFMYPIRLLGEVKCWGRPVDKEVIRELIGVAKDIQENEFSLNKTRGQLSIPRYTECFAIFSASGFKIESERLAYAHNIKTVSFKDDRRLNKLVDLADSLAEIMANAGKVTQNRFLKHLFDILVLGRDLSEYPMITGRNNGRSFAMLKELLHRTDGIKTVVIGTIVSGDTLFFESNDCFPFERLFEHTDTIKCRIASEDGCWFLYPVSSESDRLYFSMPEMVLQEMIVKNGRNIYPKKGVCFKTISFRKVVGGINRYLSFVFDENWLRGLLE